MICPPLLRDRYREKRVLPFIGAGASMAVRWQDGNVTKRGPSWNEMVDRAATELGFSPALLRVRGTDLQILEYYKAQNSGRIAKLSNWLLGSLRPPDQAIRDSLIHQELARLDNCELFYTTNYDDLLERNFDLNNRSYKIVAAEEQMGMRGSCEIVKFHGDFNHPDKMVVTESDYQERLKLTTDLDLRFRSDLLGRVVLFVGYSFRDTNIPYIFSLFSKQFATLTGNMAGRRAFITVPDPSDFEKTLFRDRNIEVIPIRGSAMSEDVSQLLKEMRS